MFVSFYVHFLHSTLVVFLVVVFLLHSVACILRCLLLLLFCFCFLRVMYLFFFYDSHLLFHSTVAIVCLLFPILLYYLCCLTKDSLVDEFIIVSFPIDTKPPFFVFASSLLSTKRNRSSATWISILILYMHVSMSYSHSYHVTLLVSVAFSSFHLCYM